MIWFIGYIVIALVAWVLSARHLGTDGDSEDRILAVLIAGGFAVLWPISLLGAAVYFLAFRKSGREDEQR